MSTANRIAVLKELRNFIDDRINELDSFCPVCDGRGRVYARLKYEGGRDTILDCYRCKGTGKKKYKDS